MTTKREMGEVEFFTKLIAGVLSWFKKNAIPVCACLGQLLPAMVQTIHFKLRFVIKMLMTLLKSQAFRAEH